MKQTFLTIDYKINLFKIYPIISFFITNVSIASDFKNCTVVKSVSNIAMFKPKKLLR